ncbi:MAG: hypothetical protein EOP11_21755, partial [Proteobacteria bacterium]
MPNSSPEAFHRTVREEYENQNRLMSFDDYLALVRAEPAQQVRSSAQYMVDMMDSFGRDGKRFKVFDQDFVDPRFRLVGQEAVQDHIYQILRSFIREGINNKLI